MITEPVYSGETPSAGGQAIRCGCGQLATHRARYQRDDGALGVWREDPVCESCARTRVVSPDPPPKRRAAPRLDRPRVPRPQVAPPTGDRHARRRPAVVGHLT